jgi:hypothetical protein
MYIAEDLYMSLVVWEMRTVLVVHRKHIWVCVCVCGGGLSQQDSTAPPLRGSNSSVSDVSLC